MKPQALILRLKNSCHEHWDDMEASSCGARYCSSCGKSVTDFSGMSDHELVDFLQMNRGGACGRFRADQLDRKLFLSHPPKKNNSAMKWIAATLVLGSTAGVANAQCSTPQTQVVVAESDTSRKTTEPSAPDSGVVIRGQIVDAHTRKPVAEANIRLEGKDLETVSDSAGYFTLRVPSQMQGDSVTCIVKHFDFQDSKFTAVAGRTATPIVVPIKAEEKFFIGLYIEYEDFEERNKSEE